ncbi:MAG TPA: alkaline phosphatase family protein [Actinomycetota bacterium]|nr:alkaline phosphatase family protein [Actinomycetota bacterium]
MPSLTRRPTRKPLTFRSKRKRVLRGVVVAAIVAALAGGGYLFMSGTTTAPEIDPRVALVAPCDLPRDVLERVWRGYVPKRSGDVLAMELEPNQFGTRHSTPFGYTQDVPLVLYGPGYVQAGASIATPATVADLAPTYAELLGFEEFPDRDGRVLEEALLPPAERNGTPKLILTIVWDGGGDNVLEQWPEAWPNLRSMIASGTEYVDATVGSSPSITPSIHSTIGTGAFPQHHGISDTRIRIGNSTVDAFEGSSPKYLEMETIGDLWDAANGNAPVVGMFARDAWHLGMIGHGAFLPEGDKDIAIMDQLGGVEFRTNEDYYTLPEYLLGLNGLKEAVADYDVRDGEADQQWLENTVLPFDGRVRYTPAWGNYQTDKLLQTLTAEGVGVDDIADLFYVNYKAIDLAGHEWNMVEPEVRDVLIETDAQLPKLIAFLDATVGPDSYVLALTADHGMTPFPEVTRGWSIETRDMTEDIEARFDKVTPKVPLVLSNRGYQIMLDPKELELNGVSAAQVAAFVRNYRIEDNVTATNQILPRFEGRTDERLFLSAFTPKGLERALACAR